ncbi:28S ribosomal protein S15, mitochondrial [Sciurus carolinensis]|uniref:Small ribosomal subunit protein uS15m n=1 Tax=Sciurus carolinensis TaxID=30640 RepID=A0AA41MEL8_SCICA|nr:28S ribosomal protein S15, mitochondrial isoform X2 [Sciurus carolinensis]MBZ3870411.1 28S ribosomal protein S15, mitochondrial [Sciurus carolinensis]
MLRAAWRALSSVRTQAVTQAPVSGLLGRGSARLPSDQWGLQPQSLLQAARGYTIQKPVQPKQDDDPPPSTLLKDYQNIPGIEKVDDVVRRLLSLEMANQKEKLKIKQEQLMNKIVANPEDTSSLEARIVALTIKIRNYEEHMQKHRKDKAHKRYLLMSIDQRKKMLKNLRKTNYDVFEKTCRELGIEYTFPPLYYRTAHRRFVAKRALCLRVFQEAQKLKKQKRILKAAAMATPKQDDQGNPENPSKACTEALKGNQ